MIKRLVLSAIIMLYMTGSVYGQEDPGKKAQEYFSKGNLSEGRWVLLQALNDESLSIEMRAKVMEKLARFYERYVGDLKKALKFLDEIAALEEIPDNAIVKISAQKNKMRLEKILVRFSREDLVLKKMSVEVREPDMVNERIAELEALIRDKPDYPKIARVYYYLGTHFLALERYREAYDAFDTALELRPGLGFSVAAEYRRDISYRKWLYTVTSRTVKVLLGVLLLCSMPMFYMSRPWQWVGIKHVSALILLALLWACVFGVSVWMLGRRIPAAELRFAPPVFVNASWGSPGSEILTALFWYGLIGVLGAFVITVSTNCIRLTWTRAVLTVTVSMILCCCLVTVFYLRNCYDEIAFEPEKKRTTLYPKALYFEQVDIGPFILIDPVAYPGLDTSNFSDPVIMKWLEKYSSLMVMPDD